MNLIKCLRLNVYQTFIVKGQKVFKLGALNYKLWSLVSNSLMLSEWIEVEKRPPSIKVKIMVEIKITISVKLSLAGFSTLKISIIIFF